MAGSGVEVKINPEVVHEPFWAMDVQEVFRVLAASPDGLGDAEAGARAALFGPNAVPERGEFTALQILLKQFESPLILVLIAAGITTVFLGEWVETGVIFAAVAVNTALGFWQEHKAESVLALLKTYVRTRARVRRENREREIDAQELVPGDIIRVSRGDRVPADARLLFANSLALDEAVLTGESLPVPKDPQTLPAGTNLPERASMVFSGTLVTEGFGDAVVSATAMASEFGKIVALVRGRARVETPLEQSLGRFAVRAGVLVIALALVVFALGLASGYGLFEMFLIAVAIAVAAVPEGLPVALTVILAIGVERLATKKAIVRRLLAAETLGQTSVILTDKTGTLTQAKMELAAVLPAPGARAEAVLSPALLNTDVVIENPDDPPGEWRMFGRALELALVRGASRSGVLLPELVKRVRVLDRLPFSAKQKFAAAIAEVGGERRLMVFGAPEVILSLSTLRADERSRIATEVDRRARAGERVLGVGSRVLPGEITKLPGDLKFGSLEFRGLLALRDPLRREVQGAIRRIADAGVKTVIVTGDHRGTAEAVGRELGLVDGAGAVLSGEDLQHLRPDELRARLDQVSVYARVTPEQKVMLVTLYQSTGQVVAVTGDGVNDAPALEAADIGVAVGSGTDVAKSAADLVILDDNFETIVRAIEEGRRILSNIRKVIVYLLSGSLDELFLIGGALVTGLALPLNALQILFVNFFSDSFPAIALAFEEEGIDRFDRKPDRSGHDPFDRQVRFLVLVIGVLTSFLLFVLYYLLLRAGLDALLVRTFTFASFATYALFLAFSVRSLERSILSYNPFSNRYLVGGVLIGLALTAAVTYLPILQGIFGTVALPGRWVSGVLGVGFANIALVEFGKWLFRRQNG